MNFSHEQAQAIMTLDQNLMVLAGAGSGKTRVLVERFVQLLAQHPHWSLASVVAITFTRAAATEMKNRLRERLLHELQATQEAEAQARWGNWLQQMDSARVDTIHGLCADILRANAAPLGIDPAFVVLEDIEARLLLARAMDAVFQIAVNDGDFVNIFEHYREDAVRQALVSARAWWDDLPAEMPDAETIVAHWYAVWEANAQQVFAVMREDSTFLADAGALETFYCNDPSDKLYPSFENVRAGVQAFLAGDAQEAWNGLNLLQAINLKGGKDECWNTDVKDVKAVLGSLREQGKTYQARIGTPPIGEAIHELAALTTQWHALALALRETYRQAKRVQNALDFEDLESLTMHILTAFPSVRERYHRAEFQHVMVDEFQDTNARQWAIVQALTGLDAQGTLFVVGDIKQSIYAFRGADVTVFDAVRQQITQSGGVALPLSMSYRSQPSLIALFNSFFEQLMLTERAQVNYAEGFRMDAARPEIPVQGRGYATLECLLIDQEIGKVEDTRKQEAFFIAQRLKELKDTGALVFDRHTNTIRPFEWRDASILLRVLSNVKLYEDALDAHGIPFVTAAGRGYYNRQEVLDLINLLKALYNNADNLSLAAALRSPLFGLSDDELLRLRRTHTDLTLWEAVQDLESQWESPTVARVASLLGDLVQMVGRVTIAELLRLILQKTAYLATLNGLAGGARLRRNAQKLLEVAEKSERVTLGAFLAYVDEMNQTEVREGEATQDTEAGVKLMSVHTSKGLEFPFVFVADASWSNKRSESPLVFMDSAYGLAAGVPSFLKDELGTSPMLAHYRAEAAARDEEEHKRLLYVAMTRAQDAVFISGQHKNYTADGWLGWVLETFGIDHEAERLPIAGLPDVVLRVYSPEPDERAQQGGREEDAPHLWEAWEALAEAEVFMPPQAHALPVQGERLLEHISATQLANLGGYRHSEARWQFYQDAIRMSATQDVSAMVVDAQPRTTPRVTRRLIGQIVHEALRHWQFSDTSTLQQALESYAWRLRLTNHDDMTYAVAEAQHLLRQFQKSEVYAWIDAAKRAHRPVLHELPFIFRTGKRILHGIMDMLFQDVEGRWVIVDYKTSYLAQRDAEGARDHARQYHLQVGAYAAAVTEYLQGVVPEVYVHYISYNQTVHVPPQAWQEELERLEDVVGDLISDWG